MIRRLSASGFALVMITIIALRVPALAFCLCDHQLILNDGTCCTAPIPALNDCDCCEEDSIPANPAPCDDCVVTFNLDPGDFLWCSDPWSPTQEIGAPIVLPVGLQDDVLFSSPSSAAAGPIRGSPPWRTSCHVSQLQVLRL